MSACDYEMEWGQYAYPETGARFADRREARSALRRIDLKEKRYRTCGPPVLVEDDICYTDTGNNHWMVLGYTRSKKTRCFIRPLLSMVFQARESSIILDVKGELATDPLIRNHMEQNNIRPVFLDFRNCKADGYNLLEYPLALYSAGEEDKAMLQVTNLVASLMAIYHTSSARADPFWESMSKSHCVPIIQMLLDIASKDLEYEPVCNLSSLGAFANESGTETLKEIVDENYWASDKNAVIMLKSVLSAPDKTRSSIVATTSSALSDLLVQEELVNMLSVSTFDILEIYEKPTAVFLIIPDETSAFCNIAGLLTDIFYSQLVGKYTERYQNTGKPPCRINFVIDEFCNARISDMRSKISAGAGRFMRWFLVCQSLNQLKEAYEDDWSTIIGNCRNTMFLQGADPDMLSYISDRCGKTYITEKDEPVPLVLPDDLKRLKKETMYKEAIYIRDELLLFTRLPDIDYYECFRKYHGTGAFSIPQRKRRKVKTYTPEKFLSDLNYNRVSLPFSDQDKENKQAKEDHHSNLQRMFDDLFE